MPAHCSKNLMILSALSGLLLVTACGEKPEVLLASANAYLTKNENKAAIIQVKNALQINPDLPEARFLLGRALLESGNYAGAETELRKALDLAYPQDEVAPYLAKVFLARGQAQKLIDEYGKTELTQPAAQASLLMSLVAAYAVQGNAELSQASLDAALLAQPGYPAALVQQAQQKAIQHDFDGAQDLLAEVISSSPANHDAWKLTGDIDLHAKGKIKEALEAYRKAVHIKPDFLAGHIAIITLLLHQGNTVEAENQLEILQGFAPNHPRTKYLEAQLAYEKKDFKVARNLVQQVLQVLPMDLPGLQLAGTIELQLNALPQAQEYFDKALKAAPTLVLARRLLVVTYLRTGQIPKAVATLLPGLNGKTIDPKLLPLAGEVFLQSGDIKKAEEYFTQARRLTPGDNKIKTSLALVHLINGSADSALSELRDIAVSDTGTTADMALISVHLNRREYDQALQAIGRLEKKQPDRPMVAHLRARTLLAKKDVMGARKSFEQALTIDPAYFPAAAGLAALDLVDKQPEKARMRFKAVLAKDPQNAQALLALAELAGRSGASHDEVAQLIGHAVAANPTEVSTHLSLIGFHLRNKDNKSALSAAQNAVVALPDNPHLLDALGVAQQAAGEYNQAIATYTKVTNLQPHLPLPYLRLSQAQLAVKDVSAANTSLRRALAIKPDLLDAQRALIGLHLEAKKFQDAIATAQTVQKQRPTEAIGYALEGDIHVHQKKWASAAAAYRGGLKQVKATELALKLHTVLVADGQNAEADKFSTLWQKEHPKDSSFLFYLGDTALAHKDYSTAEKNYARVVQLQPNSAIANNNLAWVTAKLNKEGAIAYAEKAHALAPHQPAYMDTLAMLLSDKGDYAKALELQNKALLLQPTNTLFKLNLAKIHIKGGEKELARKALHELNQLGEKFPAQLEVSSLLKSL